MWGKSKVKSVNAIKKRVYYIGLYSDLISGNNVERDVSPAAVDKMNYIAETIVSNGHELEILSPSWLKNKKFTFCSGRPTFNKGKIVVKYAPSFSTPFRITTLLSQCLSLLWLFWNLLCKVNKDDIVLVYHSVILYWPVLLAKKVKRFNLILEIEEIYHLFTNCSARNENALISLADSYIISNILLTNYFRNKGNKNQSYTVLYGAYKMLEIPKKERKGDDLIKVVYAGVIEEQKRGAFNSVLCSEKLSNKYRVFIIGFGSTEVINKLQMEIDRVNNEAGIVKCEYLGVKHGLDYDNFLFNSDIGIIPQASDEAFVNFGFPSKILSYLSHNLRTISSKLECVATSEFADYVVMVPAYSPENFANAIMEVDLQAPFNAIDKINEANHRFSKELEGLLQSN